MSPDMFRGLGAALAVFLTLCALAILFIGFLIGRCT